MTIPIIPTLHLNAGILKEKTDVVAYLIRHTLTQSSKVSNTFGKELVSFRELDSKYGGDPEELQELFSRKLNTLMRRYFPDGSVSVDVTMSNKDTDGQYSLEIRATNVATENNQQTLILTDAKVTMRENYILDIKFTGAKV